MKKLLIILLLGCSGCKAQNQKSHEQLQTAISIIQEVDKRHVTDTVKVYLDGHDKELTDSLLAQLQLTKSKLFIANYKVERVRYYLKIAIKNPTQTKFLKSWISRAIE